MRSRFTSASDLVERAQLAQVVGLVDDRGDRAAEACGGGDTGGRAVLWASRDRRRINGRFISTGVDAMESSPGGVKTLFRACFEGELSVDPARLEPERATEFGRGAAGIGAGTVPSRFPADRDRWPIVQSTRYAAIGRDRRVKLATVLVSQCSMTQSSLQRSPLIVIGPMAIAAWLEGRRRIARQPARPPRGTLARLSRVRGAPARVAGASIASASTVPVTAYTPGRGPLPRRDALVLLAVLGTGVFLAGPGADDHGGRPAVDRRRTSPDLDPPARGLLDHQRLPARVRRDDAAGRPAGGPVGRPPAVPGALSSCSRSAPCWPGMAPTLDLLIAARLVQAVGGGVARAGGDGGRVAPVRRRRPGRGRSGVIGALTFLGMAAGPFLGRGDPGRRSTRRTPSRAWASRPAPAGGRARARVALGLLRQRPDRHRRPSRLAWAASAGWETPRRRAAASTWSGPCCSPRSSSGRSALLPSSAAARTEAPPATAAADRTPVTIGLAWPAWRQSADRRVRRPRPARPGPVPRPAAVPAAPLLVGDARLRPDRLRLRDGDRRRRRCSWTASCTAARTSSGSRSGRSPARPRSGRSCRASWSGPSRAAPRHARRPRGLDRRLLVVWRAGRRTTSDRGARRSRSALFGVGFGLTVTPRSTAAVEAVARRHYGIASSIVTVARMIGMAVGLAILTAYGSTTIDRSTTRSTPRRTPTCSSSRGAPGPAAAGPARGRGAGGVGGERGGADHGRPVPRRRRRDGRRGPAGARAGPAAAYARPEPEPVQAPA